MVKVDQRHRLRNGYSMLTVVVSDKDLWTVKGVQPHPDPPLRVEIIPKSKSIVLEECKSGPTLVCVQKLSEDGSHQG